MRLDGKAPYCVEGHISSLIWLPDFHGSENFCFTKYYTVDRVLEFGLSRGRLCSVVRTGHEYSKIASLLCVDTLQEMWRMQGETHTTRQKLDAAQQRLAAQPPAQAFSPLIGTRMLTKPRSFSGREEDRGTFATMTRAYSGTLDPRLCTEMETASTCGSSSAQHCNAARPETQISNTTPPRRHVGGWRSSHDCRNRKSGEVLELRRKFAEAYEPKAGTRAAGRLPEQPREVENPIK